MAGIKNAKVLPEPVFAWPNKSLPSSKWGIDLACAVFNDHNNVNNYQKEVMIPEFPSSY